MKRANAMNAGYYRPENAYFFMDSRNDYRLRNIEILVPLVDGDISKQKRRRRRNYSGTGSELSCCEDMRKDNYRGMGVRTKDKTGRLWHSVNLVTFLLCNICWIQQ